MGRLIDTDDIIFTRKRFESQRDVKQAECDIACTPTADEWIPVKEKLPENETEVLVTVNGYKGLMVRTGFYARGIFMNDNGNRWHPKDKDLVAWKPIPEPYRGG